ncbi:MAG TPA: rhomboid family intramembrane serine protease [Solirubrobacterales bacterium]
MSSPELSVVCKSCGSEVSPYVTECPYCGTRLRKRAPQLERVGDELTAKESKRQRRTRRRQEAAAERAARVRVGEGVGRAGYVTIAAILAPAILLLVHTAAGLDVESVGAIVGPIDGEWWRYVTAPWVFDDAGYLFVIAVALAIFCPGLERRLGPIPTALLLVASGSLGMLAAVGIDSTIDGGIVVAAGGNGVALGALCAWYVIRRDEADALADDPLDWIGVLVAAAVLLLLPVVDSLANFPAGVAGGIVGAVAGLAATAFRRE